MFKLAIPVMHVSSSVAAEEFRAVEAVGFTEVAAEVMGAVVGIGNRRFVTFLADREI